MRCPACGAENAESARKCASCGERFGKKRQRADALDPSDSPFTLGGEPKQWAARSAYLCGVVCLVPPVGLVLGPVAVALALGAWRRGRRDPAARRDGLVYAALGLGVVTFLFQGVGLALLLGVF